MAKRAKELKLTMAMAESMDGGYVGYIEELPGCATQGDTMEELQENMRELVPDFLTAMVNEFRESQAPQHMGKVVKRKTYRVKPLELVTAR